MQTSHLGPTRSAPRAVVGATSSPRLGMSAGSHTVGSPNSLHNTYGRSFETRSDLGSTKSYTPGASPRRFEHVPLRRLSPSKSPSSSSPATGSLSDSTTPALPQGYVQKHSIAQRLTRHFREWLEFHLIAQLQLHHRFLLEPARAQAGLQMDCLQKQDFFELCTTMFRNAAGEWATETRAMITRRHDFPYVALESCRYELQAHFAWPVDDRLGAAALSQGALDKSRMIIRLFELTDPVTLDALLSHQFVMLTQQEATGRFRYNPTERGALALSHIVRTWRLDMLRVAWTWVETDRGRMWARAERDMRQQFSLLLKENEGSLAKDYPWLQAAFDKAYERQRARGALLSDEEVMSIRDGLSVADNDSSEEEQESEDDLSLYDSYSHLSVQQLPHSLAAPPSRLSTTTTEPTNESPDAEGRSPSPLSSLIPTPPVGSPRSSFETPPFSPFLG